MSILENYIKHLLKFKNINPKYSSLMVAIIDEYKRTKVDTYSLEFTMLNATKKVIANNASMSVSRINHILPKFINAGLLERVSNGTYKLSKVYFDCNAFDQIKEIKAVYDYVTRQVKVNYILNQSPQI